ncbi:hypothetical protein F5Y06DRAFT_265177 [Hypoxylon sp. FL0890]|nr:hypothetical protein F5Y06DRAFT_265177 [Hypoxylon sp. FL0890]
MLYLHADACRFSVSACTPLLGGGLRQLCIISANGSLPTVACCHESRHGKAVFREQPGRATITSGASHIPSSYNYISYICKSAFDCKMPLVYPSGWYFVACLLIIFSGLPLCLPRKRFVRVCANGNKRGKFPNPDTYHVLQESCLDPALGAFSQELVTT